MFDLDLRVVEVLLAIAVVRIADLPAGRTTCQFNNYTIQYLVTESDTCH